MGVVPDVAWLVLPPPVARTHSFNFQGTWCTAGTELTASNAQVTQTQLPPPRSLPLVPETVWDVPREGQVLGAMRASHQAATQLWGSGTGLTEGMSTPKFVRRLTESAANGLPG